MDRRAIKNVSNGSSIVKTLCCAHQLSSSRLEVTRTKDPVFSSTQGRHACYSRHQAPRKIHVLRLINSIIVLPVRHLIVLVTCFDPHKSRTIVGALPKLLSFVSFSCHTESSTSQLTSSNSYSSIVCSKFSLVNPFASTNSLTLFKSISPLTPLPTAAAPDSRIPRMRS